MAQARVECDFVKLGGLGGVASPDLKNAPPPPPPLPTAPAALLAYIRDVLHCRVTLAGDTVLIQPTYLCPPPVVAAALAVVGDLRAILRAGGDGDTALLATAPRLVVTVPSADEQQKSDVCVSEPASRLFCGPQADPLSAKTAPAEAPDRHPAAATDPPADLIERLAQANAAPRPWQRVVDDPAAALAYCRGQARRRLDRLNPLARGLLVQAEEADARRWAAMAVHASVNGQ
jgi:hypothetical protein